MLIRPNEHGFNHMQSLGADVPNMAILLTSSRMCSLRPYHILQAGVAYVARFHRMPAQGRMHFGLLSNILGGVKQ